MFERGVKRLRAGLLALLLLPAACDSDHEALIKAQTRAEILSLEGRHEEALQLARKGLERGKKAFGRDHLALAPILHTLVEINLRSDRVTHARYFVRWALEIQEQRRAVGDPALLARSFDLLSRVYHARSRCAEAEPPYLKALAIWKAAGAPEADEADRRLFDIAFCLLRLRNLEQAKNRAEAARLFENAVMIRERRFGPDHPQVAELLREIGWTYMGEGRLAKAEAAYRRALAMSEKAGDADREGVIEGLGGLAAVQKRREDYAGAMALVERRLEFNAALYGPEHPRVAADTLHIAQLLHRQGRYAEAEPVFQRALEGTERAYGAEDSSVEYCLTHYAAMLDDAGRSEEAAELRARAAAIRARSRE